MAKRGASRQSASPQAGAIAAGGPLRQAFSVLTSDPTRAETLARKALDADPGNNEARSLLGAALRRKGELEPALAVLAPLAASAAAPWIAHGELAQVLLALGQSRAAVAPLRRALELNPGWTPGWRQLGDIVMAGGDFNAARSAYDRQIRSMIRDPRLLAALDAMISGRLDAAERDLRALLAAQPAASAATQQILGEVLWRLNRPGDAAAVLRHCLAAAPEFYHARRSLADVLYGIREFAEAVGELDRLLARDPADCRSVILRAAALNELGEYEKIAQATAAVLAQFPDQPRVWLVQGNCLRNLGRIEQSISAYKKAIECDPAFAEAYWALANLKTFRFKPEQLAAMENLLARDDLPPKDRAELFFALGHVRENEGSFAAAFENYVAGNALERARRPYNPDATSAGVRRLKSLFTRSFVDGRAGWGATQSDPIFIVGLPRSGSTLVEQILASHSMVEGAGELPELATSAAGTPGYPDSLVTVGRDTFVSLGGDYLRRAQTHLKLGRPRFTDKTPANCFHAGLILLALPNAKIVDVRRHPLACGVANFRQHFARGFECSYDLTDLGRYYADYVDLMAHFDRTLPGRVHRVIYEDLVADTETEVRRLLAYLDLPFEPACLRFFENPRAVDTPSSEQVRQPIFTDGLDQWRHFEPWLDPLKAALGSVLDAYPAAPI
jgi:tetratricopeptide (TPR) repeat protein